MIERIFGSADLLASERSGRSCIGCRLGPAFALHLQNLRGAASRPDVRCLAGQSEPAPVRFVPHFVAIDLAGRISDIVLWEFMTDSDLERWKPSNRGRSDVAWLAHHVERVVCTREQARTHADQLPAPLQSALARGRYLSALLCLELRPALEAAWRASPADRTMEADR